MARFDGKTALITGGTSGIGLATAKRLLDEGARVMVTGRDEGRIAETRTALPGAIVLANDAGDPEAGSLLAARVKAEFGVLDCLFLNAGFATLGPMAEIDFAQYDAQFRTNVFGPIQHATLMRDMLSDGAHILITGSISGHMAHPLNALYAAAKAAVRVYAKALARDLAPRNITVNTISPGPTETRFFEAAGYSAAVAESIAERTKANVPLGRMGKPEEVAALAAFLLSDEAAWITGSEHVIDGGMLSTG